MIATAARRAKGQHAVNHYADRPSGHDKQDADHNLGQAFPST